MGSLTGTHQRFSQDAVLVLGQSRVRMQLELVDRFSSRTRKFFFFFPTATDQNTAQEITGEGGRGMQHSHTTATV